MNVRSIPILLVALVFCLSGREAAAQAPIGLDAVRGNLISFTIADSADRTSPRVRASLQAVESSARQATASGFFLTNGSWSDINYKEIPAGNWGPWEHVRRLTQMARAYRTPGQSLYRDPRLLADIESALRFVPTFYPASSERPGNWWFWVIGIPLDLGPTLVLMQDDISKAVLDACISSIQAHVGYAPGLTPTYSTLEGQNLVWSSFNHLHLALLTGNTSRMKQVRDSFARATVRTSRDGIQTDDSFQQHGPQLYTGGYGGAFANDVARYALLTNGTEYALPTANAQVFADYVANGVAWSLFHNYFDVSVVGREVARSSTSGYHGLASLLQMSFVESARRNEITSAAKKMLQTWGGTLTPDLAGLAARIESTTITPSWPSGHRHYFESDYTIHRRPAYFASVKMLSSRTRSGESTNGENLLGARQSDGRFHLAIRGNEYQTGDVWPTMDWTRLPGITVEQQPNAAGSDYGLGWRTFVGGTGDGKNGVSAMDLLARGSSLSVKKGWFFFDDSIVFLTSDIRSASPYVVETVIDQRPIISGAPLVLDGVARNANPFSAALTNVRWAAAEGIGYYFFSGTPLKVKRETRTGSWSALGGSSDSRTVSNPMLTMWIDHGTMPVNGTAAYAVVPNIDAASMSRWAATNPLSILANNESVSAVRNNRDGSTGFIFWNPGFIDGITTDTPAIVYRTADRSNVHLSIADPNQGSGTMRITLNGRFTLVWSDPTVRLTSDGYSTFLEIPRSGRTTRITLARVRARGVRR